MGTRGAGCELLKPPLGRQTAGEDECRAAGRGARPGHGFPPACFGYWGLLQACPARPVPGAGPGPAAGPLLARRRCLLRPGGAGTLAGPNVRARGPVPFPGGAGAALRGGKRDGDSRASVPGCAPGWAPQTSRLCAAAPAEAAAPGLAALCRPPGRTDQGRGGGECASHRLLWPFCFAGGFRCRDVRDVTWGFLPPRWS